MGRYLFSGTTYTVLLLFLLFGFNNYSQGQTLDSLTTALRSNTINDTTRVNLIIKLSTVFTNTNIDSAIHYSTVGLEISEKIHFEKGQILSMQQLGNAYLQKNDYSMAMHCLNDALKLCEKAGKKSGQSAALQSIGNIYYRMTKFDTALDYYKKSVQISDEINDQRAIGGVLVNIGTVYSDCGNYPEALTNYLKALTILEKENDIPTISVCLSNISTLYVTMGDFKKALDYNQQGLSIFESSGNKVGFLSCMNNLAEIYSQMGDHTKALNTYTKVYSLADSMGDAYFETVVLGNMGEENYYLKNYDTALKQYLRTLESATKENDISTVAMAQNGIGRVKIKINQVAEGIKHLLIAFEIVQSNGMKEPACEVARDLSDAYETIHDPANALKYNKLYYNYKDSIHSDKNDMRIQQLQFDYELSKKETKIQLLEKDNIIEEHIAKQKTIVEVALATGILLLISISILLYWGIVAEKNGKKTIISQKTALELQAEELTKLNSFKDKTFSVLSHDLRGPIHSSTTLLTMMDEGEITHEEFMELKIVLLKQMNAITVLLDSLLKWSKGSMQGKIEPTPANTNLYDIVRQNAALLNESLNKKTITLTNNIPQDLMVYSDPDHLDIVIRNLITNAVKFTRPNGTIALATTVKASMVYITVTDNGIGMSIEQQDKLFKPSSNNTTYGTSGEKGIGLGLLLCFDFIKANKGTITVTSEVDKGTTFTVVLPLAI